jgi:hypothetical protein
LSPLRASRPSVFTCPITGSTTWRRLSSRFTGSTARSRS